MNHLKRQIVEIYDSWKRQVAKGPHGADGTDEMTTSFLDGEPSLPEPMNSLKRHISETYDNWK